MDRLPAIPVIDLRDGGPVRHAERNPAPARALRDACLAFFPRAALPLMPTLDLISRRWLTRSRSPYLPEIARIAVALANTRLAVPRPWPLCRGGAHAGRRWRFFQCYLAGLCWRIDRVRTVAFCGLRQSGANAPPHDAPLAAQL